MLISKTLMPHEIIKGREIPMNSIVLWLDNNAILVCSNFNHSRKQKLELLVWQPIKKRWVKTYAKNEYTEIMWNHHRKHQEKRSNKHINFEEMMKHDRVRKHTSSKSNSYIRKYSND